MALIGYDSTMIKHIAIDEDELEASLTFTPDQEGADWTAEKVMRILMDARIGGFNQKRAEEIKYKLNKSVFESLNAAYLSI